MSPGKAFRKGKLLISSLATVVLAAGLILVNLGAAKATFPGPNGKILFTTDLRSDGQLDRAHTELFSMNSDGTEVVNLTNSPSDYDDFGDWSPDGSKIVFHRQGSSFRAFANPNFEIWVMNADGTGQKRLTTSQLTTDRLPSWSPDGNMIVFSSNRSDPKPQTCGSSCNFDLFVMSSDGTNVQQLTNSAERENFPKYSPDGTKIAFHKRVGGHFAILTINSDGTNVQQVSPSNIDAGSPDWSPDGTKIAFDTRGCSSCVEHDLYVMDADGSNVTPLTAGFGRNWKPSWSPDGTMIAFSHSEPGSAIRDIYTIHADGTGTTNLTKSPNFDDAEPDWGA